MYSAIVLTKQSVDQLKQIVLQSGLENHLKDFEFETKQGNPLPHHMTLSMGPLSKDSNNLKENEQVLIHVAEIWLNERIGACAAQVVKAETLDGLEITTINEHPHITCCIKNYAKPFHSNQIFDAEDSIWIECPNGLELNGFVQECA